MAAKRAALAPLPLMNLPAAHSCAILTALTIACLGLFSGRAFHIDDPLFIWTAQHILKAPLNPYNYPLVWDFNSVGMYEVTQNPPLAAYYAAVVGPVSGWSERALHCWFMLPALVVVLGTYYLAKRWTKSPLLAALATLLTPGFLVSAASVMCDVLMLALWTLAVICWVEGDDSSSPVWQIVAAFLIGSAALTKYYGAALIPLLLLYSLLRRRHIVRSLLVLLIPVAMLTGYEMWTAKLYGLGMLARAGEFANSEREATQVPFLAKIVVGLSFAGGCSLTALMMEIFVHSARRLLAALTLGACAAAVILLGWLPLGMQLGKDQALPALERHWMLIGTQLSVFIAAGALIAALAISDLWRNRSSESALLCFWVLGTLVFAGFLNWTVNARSVLPLIPPVGILLARRFDTVRARSSAAFPGNGIAVGAALTLCGLLSLWAAAADTRFANAAREAASEICERARSDPGRLWFGGHWGFQYYLQGCGAEPADFSHTAARVGDLVALPENNVQLFKLRPEVTQPVMSLRFEMPYFATTTRWELGAGFYSSIWGPLPFSFGPVPPERYNLVRLRAAERP